MSCVSLEGNLYRRFLRMEGDLLNFQKDVTLLSALIAPGTYKVVFYIHYYLVLSTYFKTLRARKLPGIPK